MTRTAAWCGAVCVVLAPVAAAPAAHALPNAIDTVINDIQVYGFNQTVLYKNGDPFVWDRGRDLGMTNRIDRVPA
jgi:Protein of unknown function (DUF3060)